MSGHLRDEQRRLLPRWRESVVAARTPEMTALPGGAAGTPYADTKEVDERLRDWREAPSIGTAADAVAAGFVLGVPERVREPAEYLLVDASHAAVPVVDLAQRILGLGTATAEGGGTAPAANHRAAIALIRARLISTPRDPFAYVDLARRYAALGQTGPAERAFRAALALAPDSRFVLRSASRFFVHAGDPERAQEILRRAPRTRRDPWLIAAEISAAMVAERDSRLVKIGRDFTTRRSLAPVHLSELAGALGTLEINSGNRRTAKKLFAQAMLAPTDNSLAQAQWATVPLDLGALPSSDSVPLSFEARALAALRASAWGDVVDACFEWLDDEPFSHKSAALGSFAAATGLGDHEQAVLLAITGLTANPDDQTLRNNLVYSLASIGRLPEAVEEVDRADSSIMDDDTKIAWTATIGLLNYRLGNPTVGRQHYEAAISAAQRTGRLGMAAAAALNWALVTTNLRDDAAIEVRAFALGLADRVPNASIEALRGRLASAIESTTVGSGPAGRR